MNIKGTKTEENILAALKGESVARSQYTFFEEQARLEGNNDIADLFQRMSQNETMHAKLWYKLLYGNLGDSASNLLKAVKGENQEWHLMYPEFAQTAREEGLEDAATFFEQVGRIEQDHEKTFLKAYATLKGIQQAAPAPTVHHAAAPPTPEKTMYRCMFCGALYDTAPDVCPVCEAIGSFQAAKVSEK